MRKHILLFWPCMLILLLSVSCQKAYPPDARKSGVGKGAAAQTPCELTDMQQPAFDASGALIVTDISGSMNGFAQSGSTRLYNLHDALERSLREATSAAASGTQIRRCYLGDRLDCRAKVSLQMLDNPNTYSAADSRLDLFLAQQNEDQQSADKSSKAAAEETLNPYRISVLGTDGKQARNPDAGPQGACMGGADPDCIAHLIRQRVEKEGYGVWITLLLVPFRGTHYAERPLDNTQWERIQQHVAQLKDDAYFQGVNFSVQRSGTAVPFKSYTFQGVKPILVIAMSRDWALGRRFVGQFTALIKQEGVVQPASGAYSLELAPLAIKPRQITKISLPPAEPAPGVRPIITGRRLAEYFDYMTECDRGGNARFIFNTVEQPGTESTPDGLPIKFSLVPVEQQGLLKVADGAEKTYEGRLVCQPVRTGNYDVWLRLQAELGSDVPADAFWNTLHANNLYEAPERLYGLRDLVQKVLVSVTDKPRVTDCVRFRVERKGD